jgi:hypothetical protein
MDDFDLNGRVFGEKLLTEKPTYENATELFNPTQYLLKEKEIAIHNYFNSTTSTT